MGRFSWESLSHSVTWPAYRSGEKAFNSAAPNAPNETSCNKFLSFAPCLTWLALCFARARYFTYSGLVWPGLCDTHASWPNYIAGDLNGAAGRLPVTINRLEILGQGWFDVGPASWPNVSCGGWILAQRDACWPRILPESNRNLVFPELPSGWLVVMAEVTSNVVCPKPLATVTKAACYL